MENIFSNQAQTTNIHCIQSSISRFNNAGDGPYPINFRAPISYDMGVYKVDLCGLCGKNRGFDHGHGFDIPRALMDWFNRDRDVNSSKIEIVYLENESGKLVKKSIPNEILQKELKTVDGNKNWIDKLSEKEKKAKNEMEMGM